MLHFQKKIWTLIISYRLVIECKDFSHFFIIKIEYNSEDTSHINIVLFNIKTEMLNVGRIFNYKFIL